MNYRWRRTQEQLEPSACSIHDEPNVRFDPADFDIGFIGGKHSACLVAVVIDKGFDADSSCLAIVGTLLMRDADVIKVFECLGCFS